MLCAHVHAYKQMGRLFTLVALLCMMMAMSAAAPVVYNGTFVIVRMDRISKQFIKVNANTGASKNFASFPPSGQNTDEWTIDTKNNLYFTRININVSRSFSYSTSLMY
jgi:hypothetical protein